MSALPRFDILPSRSLMISITASLIALPLPAYLEMPFMCPLVLFGNDRMPSQTDQWIHLDIGNAGRNTV